MSDSLPSNNGSRAEHGMTSRRRRRLAGWLLLGWAMFWLVTVIQPFCNNLAGSQASAEKRMAIPIGSDTTWFANWHRGAPPDGGSCQGVSVATISASDTSTTGPYRPDLSFNVVLPALASLPRRVGATVAYAPTDSPSPGAPLYLRHQRLLI
jgi:hypothetical protein